MQKVTDISAKLEKQVSSLTGSNVVRRLHTQTAQLEKEKSNTAQLKRDVEALKKEMVKLNESLIEKMHENKNRTEQLRYQKLKRCEESTVSQEANQSLRTQLNELEEENDKLKSDLDEIMSDKEITTFECGQYKADIRVVCYELISRGVGSRHVSDIIKLILNRVGGLNCGRLPKPTLIRMMAFEQALIAKESAKAAMENSSSSLTLHVDGTTKKHTPYLTSLVSTDTGTLWYWFIQTETAASLLDETIGAIQEMTSIDIEKK